MTSLSFDTRTPHTTHYGEGPPDENTGRNGDYYRDVTTNRLYGRKTDGQWPDGITGQPIHSGGGSSGGGEGEPGAPGVGVPAGGTAGQVLTKNTAIDYDTVWSDPEGVTEPGTDYLFDANVLFDASVPFDGQADPLAGVLRSYSTNIGDGAATTFLVEHGLNTDWPASVTIWNTTTGYRVRVDVVPFDADTIEIGPFGSVFDTDELRVVVTG